MHFLIWLWLALALALSPVQAQSVTGGGLFGDVKVASAGYTGPADVVASPFACWSLRACSAAKRGTKSVNVCNISDVTCADLSTDPTTGILNVTTIGGSACNTAISSGTYVTGTGATVLTTATSSGVANGNVFVLASLTGTGGFAGLSGIQTATAGSTGTTISFTGTTGLGASTITGGMVAICTIKTFYDQSGATNCTTACDATQATAGNRSFLLSACPGTTWGACADSRFLQGVGYATPTVSVPIAQPMSFSTVAQRTSGGQGNLISQGTPNNIQSRFDSGANTLLMFSGSSAPTATALDATWHALQWVFNNASSNIDVDGTANSVSLGNTTGLGAGAILLDGPGNSPNSALIGYYAELAIWGFAFTNTQASNMSSNQHTFGGF